MKKIVVLFLLIAQVGFAQNKWTVGTIPNTRLESNAIHVSDPDGYLSDSAERYINMALDSIRSQADVFVVTLYSIGNADPKSFATALFNYWGIGDAATDNGVLLLFVEDQHALEFETGYGAESVLTDADCFSIFQYTIKPYFIEGDYEGGLCAGVADIVVDYGGAVPMGLRAFAPLEGDSDDYDDYDSADSDFGFGSLLLFFVFITIGFFVPVISFFRWIVALVKGKSKDVEETAPEVFAQDGVNFINDVEVKGDASVWKGKGFLRFLLYGVGGFAVVVAAFLVVPHLFPDASDSRQEFWTVFLGWITYASATCLVQNGMLLRLADKRAKVSSNPRGVYKLAQKDPHSILTWVLAPWFGVLFGSLLRKRYNNSVLCVCPVCGADMMEEEGFQLSPKRMAEEEAKAYHFIPCRCPSGHEYVLREKGSYYYSTKACKACGAYAAEKVSETTTLSPSYSHEGTKELTYECKFCHTKQVVTKSIPKLVRSSSSSSSSHSHYHSSSRSHGSFGGGRSGGGGYSGRW
ncbi:MAG: TPM domain-containing protein [Bacteroidales bacterium]|nr:TPM domain-containing protein [Bacteroidales bacterium]